MKFRGRVVRGIDVGAKFGIATANLEITDPNLDLEEGVYFVLANFQDRSLQRPVFGLLHYGQRKTFGGDFSAEVHILDFYQELYGEELEIEVLHRERDVQKFQNADALFTQVEKDILRARKFFLRREIFSQWAELSDVDHEKLDQEAAEKIMENPFFQKAQRVFAFAPLRYELHFVQKICSGFPEKDYFWPKVEHEKIHFFRDRFENLRVGTSNIREPKVVFEGIPRAQDVILVPSVALDERNIRLGRGGGFYDRLLSETQAHSISVVPDFAFVSELPRESHDQMVDEVFVIQ
ncbi:5-formyltetrahydrofolate cyclo-ligase [Candidatus Gracilibacteria bacterium]|nr:5-formyltetrahydrofolate cyclo-ligase [Candidatus Gracilibacteria bacterium]MCF7819586.1 5-formyltetrahydrofolate cyclo-ligase [Candidatus Gracilibacteria bacterium]